MSSGVQVSIPLNLYREISEFAEFNGREFDKILAECVRMGFNSLRFPSNPLIEIKNLKRELNGEPPLSPAGEESATTLNVSEKEPDNKLSTLNVVEETQPPYENESMNLNGATAEQVSAEGTANEPRGGDPDAKPVRKVVRRKRTLKEVKQVDNSENV